MSCARGPSTLPQLPQLVPNRRSRDDGRRGLQALLVSDGGHVGLNHAFVFISSSSFYLVWALTASDMFEGCQQGRGGMG